jgi:hypothetical protein
MFYNGGREPERYPLLASFERFPHNDGTGLGTYLNVTMAKGKEFKDELVFTFKFKWMSI